jgi:hypothetical protein
MSPTPSHHLVKGLRPAALVAAGIAFLSSIVVGFVKREFFFDLLFFWMAGYCMSAWMVLTKDEMKAYKETVARAIGVVKS